MVRQDETAGCRASAARAGIGGAFLGWRPFTVWQGIASSPLLAASPSNASSGPTLAHLVRLRLGAPRPILWLSRGARGWSRERGRIRVMIHGKFACQLAVLAAVVTLPGLAGARAVAGSTTSSGDPGKMILAAGRGGAGGAHGRMGAPGRSGGRPAFHPFPARHFPRRNFPFRPFPFRPLVAFGFAGAFYDPYYLYPYNPYCDPASSYYYPPWCS